MIKMVCFYHFLKRKKQRKNEKLSDITNNTEQYK